MFFEGVKQIFCSKERKKNCFIQTSFYLFWKSALLLCQTTNIYKRKGREEGKTKMTKKGEGRDFYLIIYTVFTGRYFGIPRKHMAKLYFFHPSPFVWKEITF